MSNHTILIWIEQEGTGRIRLTDDDFAIGTKYTPAPGSGSKPLITETIELIATGSVTLTQIRGNVSKLNALFSEARLRWANESDFPANPMIAPVFLVVNGLKSEIIDGRTKWEPISFFNWHNGKALVNIHIARKPVFSAPETVITSNQTVVNDGDSSRIAIIGDAIQGDMPCVPDIQIKNTTDSTRRSSKFWIGASNLQGHESWQAKIPGETKTWTGDTQRLSLFVFQIERDQMRISRGSACQCIIRFNEMPPYQPSFYSCKIRIRITIAELTDLYTTQWHEMNSESYQLISSVPLPPYQVDDSAALSLCVDVKINKEGVHRLGIDFLYLMPTDAGFIELMPHGYNLPYGYSLNMNDGKPYVSGPSGNYGYYSQAGKPITLAPKKSASLHILHASSLIGSTPSNRTSRVSIKHQPCYATFSDIDQVPLWQYAPTIQVSLILNQGWSVSCPVRADSCTAYRIEGFYSYDEEESFHHITATDQVTDYLIPNSLKNYIKVRIVPLNLKVRGDATPWVTRTYR